MRNLFRFVKIYHFVLLFILIESFSLFLYISNHKFQQSKFLSFTQEYTGAIFNYYSDLTQYLSLKDENDFLHKENAELRTLLSKEEVNTKFEGMIKALSYGAPPHGGMAPGIDRIVMLLAEKTNIREVTLFPMNQNAQDLLMGAPSKPSEKQLKELNIKIVEKKE